jgi:hypothetical protein
LGQEYSTEEIDALLERNPIHDIESVLGHDASQFWFSAVESMNDMAADALDRQVARVLELFWIMRRIDMQRLILLIELIL